MDDPPPPRERPTAAWLAEQESENGHFEGPGQPIDAASGLPASGAAVRSLEPRRLA